MIKSILVPTDGSEHAERAVGFAADLAEKYGAKLLLIHVVRDPGSTAHKVSHLAPCTCLTVR